MLGDISPQTFLSESWQKQPRLIRGLFQEGFDPLSPEELAGLALEDDIGSRLVTTDGSDKGWKVYPGPFSEDVFAALPESGWTLLVQEVNHLLPEVAALIQPFRFIPNWRLDDVMVSYAAPGGTVGPHIDSYDVFLIQGMGRRRWQVAAPIEEGCARLVPDIDLQVMADFVPTEEWTLKPGDVLYLPPGVPHHGISDTPCMTYSVGFRAPTHQEIIACFFEEAVAATDPNARYADPDLTMQTDPGRIVPEALEQVRRVIRAAANDTAIDHWFGRHMTSPRDGEPDAGVDSKAMIHPHRLEQSPASRWAYIEEKDGGCTLFVDGRAFPLPAGLSPLAGPLTGGAVNAGLLASFLDDPALGDALRELLSQLVAMGALVDGTEPS